MRNRDLLIAGVRSARMELEKSAGLPLKGMGVGALGGILHALGTGAKETGAVATGDVVRSALKGAGIGGLGEVGVKAAKDIQRAKMINKYAPAAALGAGGLLGVAATK